MPSGRDAVDRVVAHPAPHDDFTAAQTSHRRFGELDVVEYDQGIEILDPADQLGFVARHETFDVSERVHGVRLERWRI